MQRWIDGAQTHPAYAIPTRVDSPDPTPSLTLAELAESSVVQQWASKRGLRMAEEMVRTCEGFSRQVMNDVVDEVEAKIRRIMQALDVLGPESRNAVDTFTARASSREGRHI